jgi:hypothetical protein
MFILYLLFWFIVLLVVGTLLIGLLAALMSGALFKSKGDK